MSSRLESLPYELRQFIVEYVDAVHPSSLTALACSSRHLFATVKPFLFRTIRFSVDDLQDKYGIQADRISTAVQEYIKLLQRYNGIEFVQHIIIGGEMGDRNQFSPGSQPKQSGPYQWRQSRILRRHRLALASADGEPCDNPYRYATSWPDHFGPDKCHSDNLAWKPLAEFIKMLPHLKHLIYNHCSQFPPCLLETLHDHRFGCKLHLCTFDMRSAPSLDDYERKLMTSPCLHSIRVSCKAIPLPTGKASIAADHQGDIAMRHVIVAAPALKGITVNLLQNRRGARRIIIGEEKVEKPVNIVAADPGTFNSLHSLRLYGSGATISKERLQRWTSHVDFSQLKVLGLAGGLGPEMLDHLASKCHFPSLRSLFLLFDPDEQSWRIEDSTYEEIMSRLLCRVPPLLSLYLPYITPGMDIERIMKHHGPTLRRLTIQSPGLNKYQLKYIAKYCHRLEFFRLCLPRSFGDAHEVSLYHALGSIPRLVDVELELNTRDRHFRDANHPGPSDGDSYDEFHEQDCILKTRFRTQYIKMGYIRDTLMNCALDKTLAYAIFHAISAGKPKDIGRPLRKLNIRMSGGRTHGYHEIPRENYIIHLIMTVSQCWQVERDPRDDRQNDLIATRLDADDDPETEALSRKYSTCNVDEVVKRLWPRIEDMSDWQSHWHSFPLADINKEDAN